MAPVALQVVNVENIAGCAQVIPAIATRSKTEHGGNNRWCVNGHIDLATSSDVYN